jgi:hypothetical protein
MRADQLKFIKYWHFFDLNCWECYAFIVHHGEKIQSIGQGNLQKRLTICLRTMSPEIASN